LHLLGHPDGLPREDAINFVLSCQRDNGGFGAAPGHDAHILYTVSAVQILVTLDAVDELEKRGLGGKRKVGSCMICSQVSSVKGAWLSVFQLSQGYRTRKPVLSWVTNGES
jgi:prenyltransferase beta subunit